MKQWTKKELEALISKEIYDDANIILPIWLDIDQRDVYEFSPLLADKLAIKANYNEIETVLDAIMNKFKNSIITQQQIEDKTDEIFRLNIDDKKKYILDLEARVKNLFFYSKEIYNWYTSYEGKDQDYEIYNQKDFELLRKYNLPVGLSHDNEFHSNHDMNTIIKLCRKWVNQKMTVNEAAFLEFFMTDGIETDPHYILYGITNKSLKDKPAYFSGLAGIYNVGVGREVSSEEYDKAQRNALTKFYNFNDED